MRLIRPISDQRQEALDIGARDGHFSRLMAELFQSVTALDLERPTIAQDNIHCVQGDITGLNFSDNSFDLVFCTEVLEHIPTHLLEKACSELSRVSRCCLLVGVPYQQDIRVDRTTCYTCGKKNPPWGHVNSFDKNRLIRLFPAFKVREMSFVGENDARTNFMSTLLLDLAGNPYGTYSQDEPCIYCGHKLTLPPDRNIGQKVLTKAAFLIKAMQQPFARAHPNWIHVLFEKAEA